MKTPDSITGWLGLITAAVTVAGLAYGALQNIATKSYHEEDVVSMRSSLENIEASAVVQRIRGLLRSRCGGQFPPELQDLLDKQLERYRQLTDREFRQGECRDGLWFTASGVPG